MAALVETWHSAASPEARVQLLSTAFLSAFLHNTSRNCGRSYYHIVIPAFRDTGAICESETLIITADSGLHNYTVFVNGNLVSNGPSIVPLVSNLSNGDQIIMQGFLCACITDTIAFTALVQCSTQCCYQLVQYTTFCQVTSKFSMQLAPAPVPGITCQRTIPYL